MHESQSSLAEGENPLAAEALKQGFQYLENEEHDEAIKCFTAAIQISSGFIEAYLARAFAYDERGESDLAIADCSEVIRLNPEYARAYRLRGEVYEKVGKWANAERDVATARRIEARRR